MIHKMECCLFHHNVIINKLYESSNPNVEEVVNDPEQNDRIVTRKDMMSATQWQYDENEHEVYTDKKFKATLGSNGTDYIVSAGVKSETKYKTFDVQRLSDALDVAWIEQDKSSEDEKWVICSRSSGIWMGTFDANENIVLSHVERSPCCSKIYFKETGGEWYSVLLANNECFDEYDIKTVGDITTITSKKYIQNDIKGEFTFQKIATLNNSNGNTNVTVKYLDNELNDVIRRSVKMNNKDKVKEIKYEGNFPNWSVDGNSLNNNIWYSVCYGNGKFVAVAGNGSGNRAAYSSDGINWSLINVANMNNNEWESVCYGNGKFVAVAYSGSDNRAAYSSDGISWTLITGTNMNNNAWNSVCYGNGKFVAVAASGSGNRVAYSSDGISWSLIDSTVMNNNWWSSVCYGNDKFVAVAQDGSDNRAAYSSDGINWSLITDAIMNHTEW